MTAYFPVLHKDWTQLKTSPTPGKILLSPFHAPSWEPTAPNPSCSSPRTIICTDRACQWLPAQVTAQRAQMHFSECSTCRQVMQECHNSQALNHLFTLAFDTRGSLSCLSHPPSAAAVPNTPQTQNNCDPVHKISIKLHWPVDHPQTGKSSSVWMMESFSVLKAAKRWGGWKIGALELMLPAILPEHCICTPLCTPKCLSEALTGIPAKDAPGFKPTGMPFSSSDGIVQQCHQKFQQQRFPGQASPLC